VLLFLAKSLQHLHLDRTGPVLDGEVHHGLADVVVVGPGEGLLFLLDAVQALQLVLSAPAAFGGLQAALEPTPSRLHLHPGPQEILRRADCPSCRSLREPNVRRYSKAKVHTHGHVCIQVRGPLWLFHRQQQEQVTILELYLRCGVIVLRCARPIRAERTGQTLWWS